MSRAARLLWPFLIFFRLWAAQPDADAIRSAQNEAIAKQKAAARVQAQVEVQSQTADEDDFFVLPFPPVDWAARGLRPAQACNSAPAGEVKSLLADAAKREGLDPRLLEAVARTESGFDSCAVSTAGAEGVMQLMPETQATFDVRDPFDPQQSITAGARLLKQLLTAYSGDLKLALSAYNAGPARVQQAGGVPAIPETRRYVEKILGASPGGIQ